MFESMTLPNASCIYMYHTISNYDQHPYFSNHITFGFTKAPMKHDKIFLWPLLLTWIKFNPSMDK